MTKASGRPLEGPTRRDRVVVEARVATKASKRSYGLLSRLCQSQTNVWALYRCQPCAQAGGSPSVSPRIALAVGLGAGVRDTAPVVARGMREAPFPLPPTGSAAGVPHNFSPTFWWVCKLPSERN